MSSPSSFYHGVGGKKGLDRSLVKLIPLGLAEAGWNGGSDIPSPEQAVLPCAQFTPRRRCSPIAEEFRPFVPDRAPGGWFSLPEKSNDLKPWFEFLAGDPGTVLYLYEVGAEQQSTLSHHLKLMPRRSVYLLCLPNST